MGLPPRLLAPHLVAALRCALGALALAMFAGCATLPPPRPPEDLFLDGHFGPPGEPVDGAQALAISDEMIRFIQTELHFAPSQRPGPHELFDVLKEHERLRVDYDSAFTRSASQTFAANRGNCLSLALMTAAFAHQLGMPVYFQQVDVDETWTRSDNIAFLDGHVNVTLGRRLVDATPGYDPAYLLTIDFVPPQDVARLHTRTIPEAEAVAMFMNNRAAEALVRGRIDDAYWWARGAVLKSPEFMAGFNTLGVIYLRHGDADAARRVLQWVLDRNGGDRQALTNLAIVSDRQGRAAEAQALRKRLAGIEAHPPFEFYFRGLAALRRGDYREAKMEFSREVDRAQYNSEFHFWLGIANLRLGEFSEAKRQITIALAVSTDDADRGIYAAKLERMKVVAFP